MQLFLHDQDRIFEELQDVFGEGTDTTFRDCTQQDLNNLNFLECCIKESLRLYPSVHFMQREATEDIQIGSYTLYHFYITILT